MYNIYTKAISKRGWFTLLALIATICVSAQNVKGVVVDETDMPMIGATVMVKGQLILMVTSLSKPKKVQHWYSAILVIKIKK